MQAIRVSNCFGGWVARSLNFASFGVSVVDLGCMIGRGWGWIILMSGTNVLGILVSYCDHFFLF